MLFVKMALRNIWRNPLRSFFTLLTVSVSLVSLIFLWSIGDGTHRQMIDNVTSLYTGHLQIHSQGFHARMKLENTLADVPLVEETLRSLPAVEAYSWESTRRRNRK